MKFVHILGAGGMYTRDYCSMIINYFNPADHSFITGMPSHSNYAEARASGSRIIRTISPEAIRSLRACDAIIIHGMVNPKVLLLFSLFPALLEKSNWVIWGGDIYDNASPKSGVKQSIIRLMRRKVYPKVRWATTLSKLDYRYAQESYGLCAPEFEGCYPVPASTYAGLIDILRDEKKEARKDCYLIQIGNSATSSNQHIEALDMLKQYRDKNIRIFMPLNYGPDGFESYANQVIAYAETLFGKERVMALRNQVDGADYLNLLSKVDIGIFNNSRQQAMGNISQLLLLGAKIYIRDDISMWQHFESLGCKLEKISEIVYQSFDEFVHYDEQKQVNNIHVIQKRHSIEEKVSTWKYIFTQMQNQLKKC